MRPFAATSPAQAKEAQGFFELMNFDHGWTMSATALFSMLEGKPGAAQLCDKAIGLATRAKDQASLLRFLAQKGAALALAGKLDAARSALAQTETMYSEDPQSTEQVAVAKLVLEVCALSSDDDLAQARKVFTAAPFPITYESRFMFEA